MKRFLDLLKNIKRCLGLAFRFSPRLTLAIGVLSILTSLSSLLQAKILGNIVNSLTDTLHTSTSITGVLVLSGAYAGVWGTMRVLVALDMLLSKTWRTENEHGMDLMVLKKRAEIDLGHYEDPDFQDLLQRGFNRSIWPMFELTEMQFNALGFIAVILASSLVTSAISGAVYLIVLFTSIPSFVVQFKYGHKMWSIWKEHSERQRKYANMRSHLLGRIGITQSKMLQNSDTILGIIKSTLDSFKLDSLELDKKRFLYQVLASLVAAGGFGISLTIIAKSVMNGTLSIGSMVFIITALVQLTYSINSLLTQIASQMEKSLFVTDIFKMLDTKPFVKRSPNEIKLNLSTPPKIEFRNVSFSYPGRKDQILKDINLIIEPGQKIAIVGMNGAGKSTLVKLLSRIYDPNAGAIYINDINLKEIDAAEWTSYLSVLLQDYLTYDLTVNQSIAMGRSSRPLNRDLVRRSAEDSGASEFIENWEKQYNQQLGKEYKGGIEPSKGQQQKIALARAIYREGLIIILDEPTAAIDALSEMKIFEAMEKAVSSNTLIVITHRFNTTKNFDKIVVLDHGTVAEEGKHSELLKHGRLYKEMFESQAKAFRVDAVRKTKPKRTYKKKRIQPEK